MALPPPSNSTNETDATVCSSALPPRVSDDNEEPDEVDPVGKKPTDSSENPGSDEKIARDSSDEKLPKEDKLLEFMVRIDPNGFLLVLCLVWTMVLSWRFFVLMYHPADESWNTSLLVCLMLFMLTISVSDSPRTVISAFSYILLLSCAATHFIGPMNGMMVMFIGTLYAAGLLGYTTLGYCQRLGVGKSAMALVALKVKSRKHDKVGVSMLCSILSVSSTVCIARIAWLVLAPDKSHRTLFDAFDYIVEMWSEICCNVALWAMYITQFDLGGAVLSMDTFAWATPSFLFCGLLIGIFLFLAIGDAVAILFFWIATMTLMAFFGYIYALKTIITSCHPTTKWDQRSDKVYLMIELADAKDVMLNLKPDGHFNFSAKGPDEIQYELDLELFGAIGVEESKVAVGPGTICYLIKRAESNWWPILFKKEGKPPVFPKVDLDKWREEDDEDTGSDDFGDMVFVKLDK